MQTYEMYLHTVRTLKNHKYVTKITEVQKREAKHVILQHTLTTYGNT